MKCSNCGFDRILPMYKVCPKCKQPLKASSAEAPKSEEPQPEPNTKLFTGIFWSYAKAIKDPEAFKTYAQKNPNDSARLLNKWKRDGKDVSALVESHPMNTPSSTTTPKKEDNPIQQHSEAVAGAQIAAVAAAHTPKVGASDIVAVGSRNKEHNYVQWKVVRGQMARRISAEAFQELEKVDGVYIEEGTTAVIFVDGEQVAELHGGLYKFATEKVQQDALEKEEDERSKEGLVKKIGRAGRSLWALITGNKEKYNKEEARKKRERVNKIAQKLSGNSVVEVVLKRDAPYRLPMGIRPIAFEDGSSTIEFAPYKIRTKTLTLDVAVELEVRISDFYNFRTTYLIEQDSYSANDIRLTLNSWMRTAIQRIMQNYEADGLVLPNNILADISYEIILQSRQLLHGIEVSQVIDITANNENFERFQQLEEKIFVTDKEIDYLVRTNDAKNRLQTVENAQKVAEARTELDLRKELDTIFNDQLVHDDEMESFVQLLQSQKRIREAQTENEELAALLELKGNRLVSEDDFDALASSIRDKKFDRDQVSAAFQLASANRTDNTRLQLETQLAKSKILAEAELEDARFDALRKKTLQGFSLDDIAEEHRREQELKEASHSSQMLDSELSEAKRRDEYFDNRRDSDYAFEQRQKQDAYRQKKQEAQDSIDLENQRADSEMERKLKMQQAALQATLAMDAQKQQHEQEMAEKKHQEELARIAAQQNMSVEQLMATGVAGMDAAAQKAFAESFAAGKGGEKEREMYERMLKMQADSNSSNQAQQAAMMQQMMAMMQGAMQTNATMATNMAAGQTAQNQAQMEAMQNIAGARIAQTEGMKEEYRTQMEHEQKRTDAAQDKALNYTTKVTQEEIKAETKLGKNSSEPQAKAPYYLPDFGADYTLKEVGNLILNGTIDPETELEINGETLSVAEVDELLPFLEKKYGSE